MIETISLLAIGDNHLNLIYYGTQINLIKGHWQNEIDKNHLMVVGHQQQHTLDDCIGHGHLCTLGYTSPSYLSSCYIHKQKEVDLSDSEDDHYKPFTKVDTQFWKDKVKTPCDVLKIEEPSIQFKENFIYHCYRPHHSREDVYYNMFFYGNKAIIEAGNDIYYCYTKALKVGLKLFSYAYNNEKNISFPTLSADVGYPRHLAVPIAIQAILNFIQDNPFEYNSITLFVHKKLDFLLYKKLLLEHYKPIKVLCIVCHLYINNIVFHELPKDIMRMIIRLTYNLYYKL